MNVEQILKDRNATHGNYAEQAAFAQRLKTFVRDAPGWEKLSFKQKEALDHILTKISRAMHGDPNHMDVWADIAGYATLAGGWTAKETFCPDECRPGPCVCGRYDASGKPASTEPAGGRYAGVQYQTAPEYDASVRRS